MKKMRPFLKKIYNHTWVVFLHLIRFFHDFLEFKRRLRKRNQRFSIHLRDFYPVLGENTPRTEFDAHYLYHPAWAARLIAILRPSVHVDISSSLNFCTLVSAFIPVRYYDYRPANIKLEGLVSDRADLLNLPFDDLSLDSLSCMHVIEHIGLGRYGEPLDPDGDLKAIAELKRVLKPGGSLFFVVPVGKPRIQFNAHRIYSYEQIEKYFVGFEIRQFALVDDNNQFFVTAPPALANQQGYGCGCWWLIK